MCYDVYKSWLWWCDDDDNDDGDDDDDDDDNNNNSNNTPNNNNNNNEYGCGIVWHHIIMRTVLMIFCVLTLLTVPRIL